MIEHIGDVRGLVGCFRLGSCVGGYKIVCGLF